MDRLRKMWRAFHGQPIEEKDPIRVLVNEDDARERSRLSEPLMWTHDGMNILASMYPSTFGFLKTWAETEDVYTIPLEGEQRKEYILGLRAKTEIAMPQML